MPNQAEFDQSGTYVKSLACVVLTQANNDLLSPFTSKHVTVGKRKPHLGEAFQSAKEFLCQPSKDLELWCNIAGLNHLAVVEQSVKNLEALISLEPRLVKT